jgi:alpha-1,6-mannosyltransferase
VDRCAEHVNLRVAEAVAAAACSAAVIVTRNVLPALCAPLLAGCGAALAIDLARREHHAPSAARPFACIIAALFLVAIASPPHVPNDIRSYVADGRMVVHYHLSPYRVRPSALAPDPAFARVRDATAPYGPLFIGATAAASIFARTGVPERILYQAGAALAIGAALLLVWRSRRSTAALVLVGLHPAIAAVIVNGGHNDAFVGLALLAAVIATERRRYLGAGGIVAAAMLIKVTAGLALVPLAVWAFTRDGRRAVAGVIAPTLVIVVPATFAIRGMFSAMRDSDMGLVTRTSLWNLYPLRAPLARSLGDGAVTQLSLIVIGVAVVVVSLRRTMPAERVLGAVTAWLVLSAYVMPWYTVWALPLAARDPRRPLARVVAAQGALVTVAFLLPRHLIANWFVSFPLGWIAPIALLIAFVRAVRVLPSTGAIPTTAGAPVSSIGPDLEAS